MKRWFFIRHVRWFVFSVRLDMAVQEGFHPRLSDYFFLDAVWEGRE
jgi:hypothetical protein